MKIVRQTRFVALAAGVFTLGLSSSLMAMPFCSDKGYSKRSYHDPYAYSYIPGQGGYPPPAYGYHMPAYHHPHVMAYGYGQDVNGYSTAGDAKDKPQTETEDSTESSSGY